MAENLPLSHSGAATPVDQRSELERQNWALLAHVAATSALARSQNARDLIEGVCEGLVSQWPYVLAWVGMAEHDKRKTVSVLGAHGSAAKYAEGINVTWSPDNPSGKGPTGTCIGTGRSQMVADTESDPSFGPWRERARSYGIRSSVAVPIKDDVPQPVGALTVYACIPNAFGNAEVSLFESLAKEIGYGLKAIEGERLLSEETAEKLKMQEQLADALNATIEAMSKTMEWRDPYTAGHQKRVAMLATLIAEELGWSLDKIHGLSMAATVHDIGKVAIPSEILTKPTKLSELEMLLVHEHPETGYEILKDVPFPWPIAEIVRQHHERIDGSGYPNQLKGDQILDEAKLLAVADTIEAMTSHRPYRPALGLEAAMKQIHMDVGSKLEAKYVDAATKLVELGKLQKYLV